ncbi:MAG: hypothetical protein BWY50_00179 [Spirochaetes bacterium ADurb.Bin315]|jgi:hypothetical protein|nr:MAG: hypothetical protein BWY50_00179 [Spirochaetes bacterium ADurb.Bin315]
MIVPVNRTFNGRIPVEEEFSILLKGCSTVVRPGTIELAGINGLKKPGFDRVGEMKGPPFRMAPSGANRIRTDA